MATGRVDFFRRRESPKYPRRDSNEYCRNGDGGDLRRGGEGVARFRDDVRGPRRAVENGRREVEVVPEKKRKFSPIIWDKDEKKARMLKSCGAVPASSPRKKSSSEVGDVVSNESVVQLLLENMKSPVAVGREEKKVRITSKNRVVKVEAVISPRLAHSNVVALVSATTQIHSQRVETSVSPTGQIQSLGVETSVSATAQVQSVGVELSACEATVVDGLVEISQTEASAEVHTPRPKSDVNENDQTRVPTSRWATYMYSPSDDSCNSTPESGEIRREDSLRSKSRTSSSVGATSSIGGDEVDGVDQEVDAESEQLYPDSDEDDAALPQIEDSPVPRGRSTNMLNGCRCVAEFAKLDGMLGEGTYGVVYKARDKQTGEIVAIKKVKMDKSSEGGFPITSLREMNILLACNHPSIVDVKEVVHNGDDIFMVMECMDYELKLLTEASKQPFSIGELKYLVKSLLEGVKYLHDNWVLHRDLKTSNLLMNKRGELKICDFGLSRLYGSPLKQYTSEVVTLWYRAPELLLGQKKYSTAIDMWSVGCIMAELLAREALFPGKSEVEQLDKIFKTLGTPTETDWPEVSKLPGFAAIKVKRRENLLRKKFAGTCFTGAPMLSSSGLDMLTKLLTFDPAQRISADDALKHDWFKDYPEPRPFKPSSTVHDRYMALRQRQEREHLARARRGER